MLKKLKKKIDKNWVVVWFLINKIKIMGILLFICVFNVVVRIGIYCNEKCY